MINYDFDKAAAYAEKWALSRNPIFYNFDNAALGGDCTNFISQCIFAGCGVMNYTKTYGWYYLNLNNRAPSWTSVKYLYNFLISNKGAGPYGHQIPFSSIKPGDIIQLSFDGDVMSHSLLVLKITGQIIKENIFVASHSSDSLYKPLSDYFFTNLRVIHIEGVRKP